MWLSHVGTLFFKKNKERLYPHTPENKHRSTAEFNKFELNLTGTNLALSIVLMLFFSYQTRKY